MDRQVPESTTIMGSCNRNSVTWYNWIYYNEQNAAFPASKMTLGSLGPTDPEAESVLSAKILTFHVNVIRRNTFRHLTPIENENLEQITAKANFTTKVNSHLGDPIKHHLVFNAFVKISSVTLSNDKSINLTNMSYDPYAMDTYITAKVLLLR
jgi:hypothetical protein